MIPGEGSPVLLVVYLLLGLAYLATVIGALVSKTAGWVALLAVQTVVYLACAYTVTRPAPWQVEERAHDKAAASFVRILDSKDLARMERLLREMPDAQAGKLLAEAPCLAIEHLPPEQFRLVYRLVRQVRSARFAKDSEPECRVAWIALQRRDPALLKLLVDEGAVVGDNDLGWLFPGGEGSFPNWGITPETRLALFEAYAGGPSKDLRSYDWANRLAWAFTDPELSEAVLRHVGGLDGVSDHGALAFTITMRRALGSGDEDRAFLVSRVRRLIELGADVKPHLLEAACDPELADLLLRHGADPNLPTSSKGVTPLHHAIHCLADDHDLTTVRQLIAYGADVNRPRQAQPVAPAPALQIACEADELPQLVCLLKNTGARVDVPDSRGRTSLMTMFWKTPEGVHRLVACGARVNARDKAGLTPLQHLVGYEAYDAARALCSHGAEPRSLCRNLKHAGSTGEVTAAISRLSGNCLRKRYALQDYRYVLSDGRVFEGKTDATGLTDACHIGEARIVEES